MIELKIPKKIFQYEKDTNHNLQMKFSKFWQNYKKPSIYIIKDLEKEEILGKFYEKELRNFSN